MKLKSPDLSYMQNHALKPHFTSMKVLNPLLSMWNQVHAPAVAARPHRISPIGGGIPQEMISQATRLDENFSVGLTSAVPIGNLRALRILTASEAEAASSWSDEVVIICECLASSKSWSTAMDWSATGINHWSGKGVWNVPWTSMVSLGEHRVLNPSLSNWRSWVAQCKVRMWVVWRVSWTSLAVIFRKCNSDIVVIADFWGLDRCIG